MILCARYKYKCAFGLHYKGVNVTHKTLLKSFLCAGNFRIPLEYKPISAKNSLLTSRSAIDSIKK